MHITKLEVENFRSLRSATWSPGKLNILIGPNASGKSNLLSLLDLISVSARDGSSLSDHVLRRGGMQSLLWDGAGERISINIELDPDDTYVDGEPVEPHRYRFQLVRRGKTSSYVIGDEELTILMDGPIGHIIVTRSDEGLVAIGTKVFRPEELEDHETVVSSRVLDSEIGAVQAVKLRKDLSSWSCYFNFDTSENAAIRSGVITRHDKTVDADGQNMVSVLHTLYENDRQFEDDINDAMSAAFGDAFEALVFPPASDQRVQLGIRWRGLNKPQTSADLSDGTLRFLYLMAILATPEPPSLIAIDEPETGLHPRMLPIIAEFGSEAAMRSQVVLATHSPEFLDAFSQCNEKPTVTTAKLEEAQTVLTTIDSDELSSWLSEFTLGDIYRTGELESLG